MFVKFPNCEREVSVLAADHIATEGCSGQVVLYRHNPADPKKPFLMISGTCEGELNPK